MWFSVLFRYFEIAMGLEIPPAGRPSLIREMPHEMPMPKVKFVETFHVPNSEQSICF